MTRKSFQFACCLLAIAVTLAAGCGGDDTPNTLPDLPDAAPVPDAVPPKVDCDPIAQDCTAATDKCSLDLAQTATMSTWGATCRALTGMVALGQSCMRSTSGAAGVGKDNCDKGLYCSAIGNLAADVSDAARICHSFCRSNGACTGGTNPGCFALTEGLGVRDTGICIDTCNILADDGICTGDTWCQPARSFSGPAIGTCAKVGTIDLNGTCSGDTAVCKAGLQCVGNETAGFTCKTVCDIVPSPGTPTHPCPENFNCQALNGGPSDWGVCQMNM